MATYEHGKVATAVDALLAFDAFKLEYAWKAVKTAVDAGNRESEVKRLSTRLDAFNAAVTEVFDALNARVKDARTMARSLERQSLECTLRKASDQDRLVLRTLKSPAGGLQAGRALYDALSDVCRLPFATLASMAGHEGFGEPEPTPKGGKGKTRK
jgi:hypothetical protein